MKKLEQALIAEFGEEEGRKYVEEYRQIREHCKNNNITSHSINADGFCNMGCC